MWTINKDNSRLFDIIEPRWWSGTMLWIRVKSHVDPTLHDRSPLWVSDGRVSEKLSLELLLSTWLCWLTTNKRLNVSTRDHDFNWTTCVTISVPVRSRSRAPTPMRIWLFSALKILIDCLPILLLILRLFRFPWQLIGNVISQWISGPILEAMTCLRDFSPTHLV